MRHSNQTQPLSGRTVVVTRAEAAAGEMTRRLEEHGARVLHVPIFKFVSVNDGTLDGALSDTQGFDLLALGSQNAARFFLSESKRRGVVFRCPVACVGRKTEALAKRFGFKEVFSPKVFRAEALADVIVEYFVARAGKAEGRRVLFPKGTHGREILPALLLPHGITTVAPVVYDAALEAAPTNDTAEAARNAQVVTFLSGETLAGFMTLFPGASDFLARVFVAVIGPVAKERADALGVRVDLVPSEASVESLVDALASRAEDF